MAESPREQALTQLVAELGGLTGPRHWGGAYPAPVVIERCYRMPETVPHRFWLGVFRGPASTYQDKSFPGHHEDRFRVRICGLVTGGLIAGVEVATWIERLHYDLRLTVTAHQRLNGTTTEIEWGEEDIDENALQLAHIASFIQDLTLVIDDVIPTE